VNNRKRDGGVFETPGGGAGLRIASVLLGTLDVVGILLSLSLLMRTAKTLRRAERY
jgi:hypothetical protein